jgi:polyketide cyclase/dehydrase/lipid transport protein
MASVRKEFSIAAPADRAWAALADFGAVHTRLAPGFVTDCRLEESGAARIVTFSNGSMAREILVDRDATSRRLAYAIVGGRLTQHSASAQVFAESDGRCRFVWIADFLPDEFAGYIDAQMELGATIMRDALEKEVVAG